MTLSSKVKRLRYVNYLPIFNIPCLENVTIDTKGHTQMCLTFIFKVNHQGQVTDFKFSEILDIVNVRMDTKIKSAACKLSKVIQ